MLIGAPKLEDFQPISEQELNQMLLEPTIQALKQGIPVTQPTSLPMGALCRVLRTLQILGAQNALSHQLFTEVFAVLNDDHAALKARIAPIVLPPEEATAYIEKVAPDLPDFSSILTTDDDNGEMPQG